MVQLHKRFSDEQVIFLFQAYEQGLMKREEVQDTLDISRSRFFVLWKEPKDDPGSFSIAYQRTTPKRIFSESEEAIEHELMREKSLNVTSCFHLSSALQMVQTDMKGANGK